MDNKKRLDDLFRENFMLEDNINLEDKDIFNVAQWHSMEHFSFVADLESEFSIKLSNDEIMTMCSYSACKEVLNSHGIQV